MIKQNYKIFITIIFLMFFAFLNVNAQSFSPQFLISWQAQNYAPTWYQGKIFPVRGTPVEVNFEIVNNGKLVDLSDVKILWYINDELAKNEKDGLGIKTLKFNVSDYGGGEVEIRIVLPDYLEGELLDKIIKIPIVMPELVINSPYPDNKVEIGESFFQAIPFFFNIEFIDILSIDWTANNQKSIGLAENPYLLNLNISSETPKNTEINISALVKSILNNLEFANKSIKLNVK
ncbi:hypothetical protein JW698_00970 [Candidatus Wolfebacteria bacterium]|nr:hypothetical protein [Candidatus Wolfebacteria bacterium]